MSIFTCCEREDETKYLHTCACPSVQLITSSEKRDLSLCGHSEYGSTPSSPPKKYLTEKKTVDGGQSNGIITVYTCREPFVKVDDQCYRIDDGICYYRSEDGTQCSLTQSSFCDGNNYVTTCITGPKYSRNITTVQTTSAFTRTDYVDTTTYDSLTCQPTTVRTGAGTVYTPQQGDTSTLCQSPNQVVSLGEGFPITNTDVTPEFTDTKTAKQTGSKLESSYGNPDTIDLTTSYQGVFVGSGCISRPTFTGAGNQSSTTGDLTNYELSIEDTEANALSRSQLIEGTDSYSSIGVRGASYNSDPFSWSIQSAKYALLFKGLIVGKSYESGGLPFGSAEIGETYEEETNIPIPSFIAADTFYIIGGTLNVTPEKFKENNFSLNPNSYSGLSSGDLVITPTEDVQEADGYKYKVQSSSFDSEPDLYIQLEQS